MALKSSFTNEKVEAGCDEAGRGCLAGSVFAAAVILPQDYTNELLNDSKKLTEKRRYQLRQEIEREAVSWAIASYSPDEIDEVNILKASFLSMHRALDNLTTAPELILVDGNRFIPYKETPHECIVKGDGLYFSIAAASVLAKTYRDEYMQELHREFPMYDWKKNKGYPTKAHRAAIEKHGICHYHRKSFRLTDTQLKLNL